MRGYLLFVAILDATFGYPNFRNYIPNGDKIVDPCDKSEWRGVGHHTKTGGGLRNPFGIAFGQSRVRGIPQWSKALCEADSDGDGIYNGRELGDPLCQWRRGATPAEAPIGHPGICEPVDSAHCKRSNMGWYTCTINPPAVQCQEIRQPGVFTLPLRMTSTPVPTEEGTYMCVNLAFPTDRDYHVIANTGLIDNQNVIHHILLFTCTAGVTAAELAHPIGQPYRCDMSPDYQCANMIGGWSTGLPGVCHPDQAGYKIGRTSALIGALQLHWINPLKTTGLTDGSGVLLYLTPNLRPFSLGTLRIGDIDFIIPPKEKASVIKGGCSYKCRKQDPTGRIHLTTGINHMHDAGKEIKVTLKREGVIPDTVIMEDVFYDFGTPKTHSLSVDVLSGDSIHTSCVYNTLSRNQTTVYNMTREDEMCFTYLAYYPAEKVPVPNRRCYSSRGIPLCQLTDITAIVDGCPVAAFPSSSDTVLMMKFLKDNCSPYTCLTECVDVIQTIRNHPCFKNRVEFHTKRHLQQMYGFEFLALLYSCDEEIAKEKCSSMKPTKNGARCICNRRPHMRWL